jgi:3'(2'), 5'-bisphosphate nucleotidase
MQIFSLVDKILLMRQIPYTADLMPQLCKLASLAGDSIMNIYKGMQGNDAQLARVLVEHKADASPLTLADQAAHQVIVDGLKALWPDTVVVSEEDPLSHAAGGGQGDFWLVDPLDGTKEFLACNGDFTVNIALVRNGEAILGVVYAPAHEQMYWGSKGHGAFKAHCGRTEEIRVSLAPNIGRPMRVLASKSHMNPATQAFVHRLGAHELIQAGSSLKFCRIAEGAAEIYPRLGPTCEWDTAAAQAVVEAAGGHVAQLDGRPLRYGKSEVLNADFVVSNVPLSELPGFEDGVFRH